VPHCALVLPGWQLLPEQQPPQEDDVQAHCPALQTWPTPQDTHETPPVPHSVLALPGWQLLPEQQPPHEDEVHTHCPALHA
jgi:hypothetical protein